MLLSAGTHHHQNKAAKFVTNCYPKKGKEDEFSVTRLINQLGWDSLEERRSNARLSMIYKIINNHVIIKPETLPKPNRSTRTCNEMNVGAQNQLLEPKSKFINSGNTFFYQGPQLWNTLVSPEQANAPNIDAFQQYFKE